MKIPQNNYPTITSVSHERPSNTVRELGGGKDQIAIGTPILSLTSELNGFSVETEVHEGMRRETLVDIYNDMLQFCSDNGILKENEVNGEITAHSSDKSVSSYYFGTENDKGVHEISFKGENVTEEDIQKATDAMIDEMKENDLL